MKKMDIEFWTEENKEIKLVEDNRKLYTRKNMFAYLEGNLFNKDDKAIKYKYLAFLR